MGGRFRQALAKPHDYASAVLCDSPRAYWRFEERSGAAGTRLYRLLGHNDLRAVAVAGYRGFKRKRSVVIPGLLNKIIALAGELPPRRLALEVNRWLLAK